MDESERPVIDATIDRPSFEFYDIYDYPSVSETIRNDDLAQYQLIGKVTPYDVLHISVNDYVTYIKNKVPITIAVNSYVTRIENGVPITVIIPNNELMMELDYEEYDFWDQAYSAIIDNI